MNKTWLSDLLLFIECFFSECPERYQNSVMFLMTVDRLLIGNWIYWTLTDLWLQVITTILLIHRSLLVVASDGGHSHFFGLPNCSQPQQTATASNNYTVAISN
jgi:hypothetical protein